MSSNMKVNATNVSHDPPSCSSLIPHDSIEITSDSGFLVFPGSGIVEDPYLIEGYNITTPSASGIYIEGTTKHFVVRNCYVDALSYGIRIYNVASGTATIENNMINNNDMGIFLSSYDSSTVSNNTCSNNIYGIYLSNFGSSTVSNNTCSNNIYGIWLESSASSTVVNNTCNFNNVNGIMLWASASSTVINNICNNNNYGIGVFQHSDSSTIANNTCSNNNEYGIWFRDSDSSTVANNTCSNNDWYGISLEESDFCVVTYNLLQENENYGVYLYLDSDNNLVHHNTFVDNNLGGTSQAIDSGANNYWYDTVALEGNYYNDWSGTGSYSIDGSAGSIDLYPLDGSPSDPPSDPPLIPHASISITSDIGFAVFPGSGTAEDPYLIEGYNITTTDTIGIHISGTTKYFVVHNCYVNANDYGIYIDNVAAGTAIIISNTCNNNNLRGIYIYESSSSTVANNTCINNCEYGIYLGDSVSSTVSNNTCSNNNLYGIYLDSSGSSTVSNNFCSYNNDGILLYWSVNSDVTNNMCNNNDDYARYETWLNLPEAV